MFGVLAESDVIRAFVQHGVAAFKKPVHTALARPLVTCAPEDSLEQAMSTMTRERKRHLPVLMRDELVGIVSLGDLAKSQLDEVKLEVGVPRDYARVRRRTPPQRASRAEFENADAGGCGGARG